MGNNFVNNCCNKFEDKYISVRMCDFPELNSILIKKDISSDPDITYYECSKCGQKWEEHYISFHHAYSTVIFKSPESEYTEILFDPYKI